MELNVVLELEKDEKLHDYLINHSYWYRYLNRNTDNYKKMIDEYKKFKSEKNTKKINDVVDNIELLSNLMKFM